MFLSAGSNITFVFTVFCSLVNIRLRQVYVSFSCCFTQVLFYHIPELAVSLSLGTGYLNFGTCWMKQVHFVGLKQGTVHAVSEMAHF